MQKWSYVELSRARLMHMWMCINCYIEHIRAGSWCNLLIICIYICWSNCCGVFACLSDKCMRALYAESSRILSEDCYLNVSFWLAYKAIVRSCMHLKSFTEFMWDYSRFMWLAWLMAFYLGILPSWACISRLIKVVGPVNINMTC